MIDEVTRRYNKVIEDLDLEDCPMNEYDLLDIISFIVDIERAFNIQVDENKAEELIKQGTHEAWIEYIRTLI